MVSSQEGAERDKLRADVERLGEQLRLTNVDQLQAEVQLGEAVERLRGLAHGHYVGIATTDVGVNCVYCDWSHEKYGAEPLHTDDCPITKARRFLRGV